MKSLRLLLIAFIAMNSLTLLAQGPIPTPAGAQVALPILIYPASAVNGGGQVNLLCFSRSTKDSYITEVAANDLGIYTGATNCASGTLRFDVSSTAVTLASLPVTGVTTLTASGFLHTGADVTSTGALPSPLANSLTMSWESTLGRIITFGPDNATNAPVSIISSRSDGSNQKTLISGGVTNVTVDANGLGTVLGSTLQLNNGNSTVGAVQNKLIQINDSANAVGVELNVGTPSLGTCTGGTLTAGAKNSLFEVTGNTSGSCVVNFSTPIWQNAPLCFVNDETALIAVRISARTTNSITVTGAGSGDAFQVYCLGRVGT